MYPFDRFSEDAKQVLVSAQKEAEGSRHSYVGTEHVLLALLQVDGEARHILQRLGVEEEGARETIRNVLGGSARPVVEQIVPTSRVKKAIELSFAAGQREGAPEVTSRHLLIGLLEEGEGIGAHVLQDLGVTREAVAGGEDG